MILGWIRQGSLLYSKDLSFKFLVMFLKQSFLKEISECIYFDVVTGNGSKNT